MCWTRGEEIVFLICIKRVLAKGQLKYIKKSVVNIDLQIYLIRK